MALLYRLGSATHRYQQLAAGEITEAVYQDWLVVLPERLRGSMAK